MANMTLESNERLVRQERVHPAIFALPIAAVCGLLIVSVPLLYLTAALARGFGGRTGSLPVLALAPDIVIGAGLLVITLLAYLNDEVTLTNRRLLFRTGYIVRTVGEIPLENVEGITTLEPLLGRVFGYGALSLTTLGGARYVLMFVPRPQILHALLQKAVAEAKAPTPVGPPALPQDDSRYMPGRTGAPSPFRGNANAAARPVPNAARNPFSSAPASHPEGLASARASHLAVAGCCAVLAFLSVGMPLLLIMHPPHLSAPSAWTPTTATVEAIGIPLARSLPFPQLLPGNQPGPSLQEIKAAAEAGDAAAQDKLGDANRASSTEQALFWYRKAAAQGIANSQYQLAHILLSFANSPMANPKAAAMHSDEAIPWLVAAANQGVKLAQVELGQLYRDGKFVSKAVPEAFKWFSLASDGSALDFGANLAKIHRDGLILKMSQGELAEGNRRVAGFTPNSGKDLQLPEPVFIEHIKLNGITGVAPRALAIINGKTLAAGETASVRVDARTVTVRCLEIGAGSAAIAIEGVTARKELYLAHGE